MENYKEKVVLVAVWTCSDDRNKSIEFIEELKFLTKTAGGEVFEVFEQNLEAPNPKTFVGPGKLEEIEAFVIAENIDTVIFDEQLSPSQLRNIETILKCKVLDRTQLILDIFAQRASTSYARTQVALAQYQYILPRLVGMWTHLEKQKGGIGLKGPGETEIETDRRIIRNKISLLKKKVLQIDKQMNTQRLSRDKFVRVSIVGYTNAGKSTLLNCFAKAEILSKNQLFSTLDTTVRKTVLQNREFLLSDTVGFIRKLPTELIDSFKSTLNELKYSDLLIHMVDISNPSFMDHKKTVQNIIESIGFGDKPVIMVFNKIDQYNYIPLKPNELKTPSIENRKLKDWKTILKQDYKDIFFISLQEQTQLEPLKKCLYEKIGSLYEKKYPFKKYIF